MVTKCCVLSCDNTVEDAILHRIPYEDKLLYNAWLRRIQNPALFALHPLEVHGNHRVCSMHFVDHCKLVTYHECTTLKARALPTIGMPGFGGDPLARNNCFMPCVINSAAVSHFADAKMPDLLTPITEGTSLKRQCTEKQVQPAIKRAKTGAERTREHRARKKVLQTGFIDETTKNKENFFKVNSENFQMRCNDGVCQYGLLSYKEGQSVHQNYATVVANKRNPPKTAAQRAKDYRARKKALENAASQSSLASSNDILVRSDKATSEKQVEQLSSSSARQEQAIQQNNGKTLRKKINEGNTGVVGKRAKTVAQRMREHRARKRASKEANKQQLLTFKKIAACAL